MAEWIGKDRRARRCFGFDEVALAPGKVTVNPEDVDVSWQLGEKNFTVPILAAGIATSCYLGCFWVDLAGYQIRAVKAKSDVAVVAHGWSHPGTTFGEFGLV